MASRREVNWSGAAARNKLLDVMNGTGLKFSDTKYRLSDKKSFIEAYRTDGIQISQHKKSWQKKRQEQYLVRVEYILGGKPIYTRVEPWVTFPSKRLITDMMLLPLEVSK